MGNTQLPAQSTPTIIRDASSCDLANPKDERQLTLQKVVKEHHASAAPLREPQLILHDHMPHILGSGYDIGHGSDYLKQCFHNVMETLVSSDNEEFVRGPDKIDGSRIREHLGDKKYSMAFVDFFDKEFARADGDWKKVIEAYLFSGKQPMMNGLTGGLAHPLIHMSYAYAFNSPEFASEGMSLLCTDYAEFDTILNNSQTTSEKPTTSLAEIFDRIRNDERIDGFPSSPGIVNFESVMEKFADVVISHYAAWQIDDNDAALEHICDLATVCANTTYDKETGEWSFPLIHLMTSAHALRSVWPHWPTEHHQQLLRGWALMACVIYICQQRQVMDLDLITSVEAPTDRDWESIYAAARDHPAKFDVHFFKCVRAPRAFEETFGEKDGFYRKAAIKYLDGFRGWGGFGEGIPGFDERTEGWQAPELKAKM